MSRDRLRDAGQPCFNCGAVVPAIDELIHGYMLSSPGCWAVHGGVLAREYAPGLHGGPSTYPGRPPGRGPRGAPRRRRAAGRLR